MKKRLLSLLLCAALLCLSAGAMAEPVKINIFGLSVTVPESDPVLPELEKRLGIEISVEATGGDESSLVARIAGGNVPDVFRVSNVNNLKSYYESDVLLNLAPYMDKMPNLKATFTDLEWGRVSFDGGIYAIPRKGEGNYNCWYIRQDWLDKLQMDAPETFDDLLKVAIAMNNADFDGNGKNDTYALSGTYDSKYNRSAFDGFYTAYGVTAPAGILIRDGKAVMSCTLPEFKMALETIRTFVEAGVVDPEILSNTNSTMIEKMATGKVGIAYGGWANYSKPAFVKQLSAVDENASWGPMSKNIKTEYGESGASQSVSGYDAVFAINADLAQEPEKLDAVLKLFDYLATEEGMRLMSFGIEGVHYEMDGDTVVKLPAMDELTYAYGIQFIGRDDMTYCMTKFANCADIIQYCATEVPMVYHYGSMIEQPEGVNVADIKSYVLEQTAQFIYGSRPMSEYDSFLSSLYSTYNLQAYLDDATAQLTQIGYIK